MTEIEHAEQSGKVRAVVFYLMAICMVASAVIGTDRPMAGERLGWWLVSVIGAAINLVANPARFFSTKTYVRMLNDDLVREHRRVSFVVGFTVAMLSGVAIVALGGLIRFDATNAARVIVSVSLAAALASFATLELRAAR